MKKIIIGTVLLMLFTVTVKAQFVVSDPGNNIVLVKQLTEASNQTKQVAQSANYLKQSCDLLTKVNTKIQNASYAKLVLTEQVQLVTKCAKLLSMKNQVSISNYQNLCTHVEVIISKNRALTQLLTQSLSPTMKMNDSERINMLMNIEDKTHQLSTTLNNMESTYNLSNSMLKLVK